MKPTIFEDSSGQVAVNLEFVDAAIQALPEGAMKIPLGWRFRTGPGEKHDVFFTSAGDSASLYQVTFEPSFPDAWNEVAAMIPSVQKRKEEWASDMLRLGAATPSGLYGYTKAIQKIGEGATRRLMKQATKWIIAAYQKDPEILTFLRIHAKKAGSLPAKVLISCWEAHQGTGKTASRGAYGIGQKTVKLGLRLCADVRVCAGEIAADLQERKAELTEKILGFFSEHAKKARCRASKLIALSYADLVEE
jgi:hypothetical protein